MKNFLSKCFILLIFPLAISCEFDLSQLLGGPKREFDALDRSNGLPPFDMLGTVGEADADTVKRAESTEEPPEVSFDDLEQRTSALEDWKKNFDGLETEEICSNLCEQSL